VLPAGLRPRTAATYALPTSAAGIAFVAILTTGQIEIRSGFGSGVYDLSGISYRIAP